jgi:16S rRNA (guanine527-N7)-methyltransferase
MALAPLGPSWLPLLRRAEELLGGAGGPVSDLQASQLVTYLDELATWGRRVDLTAARSAEELVDLTLADAAVIAHSEVHGALPGEPTFIDVGTGAGAPGVIVGILRPGWRGTLVEPREKRVAFLRTVIGRLDLELDVSRGRSERLLPGGWHIAMSRATLPPEEWLAEGTRLARRAVWVLLAKGQPPASSGWRVAVDQAYELPLTGAPRRAVCYVPAAP